MHLARRLLAAAIVATFASGPAAHAAQPQARPAVCPAPLEPWTQVDLYFGRKTGAGGVVTERMFRRFLAEVVTPRFPDGLTVLDAAGQFRDSRGRIVREPTKLLVLLLPDRAAAATKVAAVIDRYKRRFDQESVLRTERAVCLAF